MKIQILSDLMCPYFDCFIERLFFVFAAYVFTPQPLRQEVRRRLLFSLRSLVLRICAFAKMFANAVEAREAKKLFELVPPPETDFGQHSFNFTCLETSDEEKEVPIYCLNPMRSSDVKKEKTNLVQM